MSFAMLSKHAVFFVLLAIVVVKSVIQLSALGSFPNGLTWDEAAIGYNGFAVVTTRRDEWLQRLPLSFKSFGDYKAPLAIYLNGIFTVLFGLTPAVVRLPFALASIIGVIVFYFFAKYICDFFSYGKWYPVLATALFAFSPWHIHYGRVGFESSLALTLFLVGMVLYFLSSSVKEGLWIRKTLIFTLSIVFFVLTFYTYHSSKIVVPLLVLVTICTVASPAALMRQWKLYLFGLLLAAGLLYPLAMDTIFGGGGTRASVLIFSSAHSSQEIITTIGGNYLLHLSPAFLISGAVHTLQLGTGKIGVLYPTTYLLVIIGFLRTIFLVLTKNPHKKIGLYACLFILIGLLPATLSTEVPHPNRALFALPGFILLALYGFHYLIEKISQSKAKEHLLPMVIGTFILLHLFLFINFWSFYTSQYPALSADAFLEGYIQAATIAKEYERGLNGKPGVDRIIFSSEYQQPYIFTLFVRKTSPLWYQGGSLIKYEFKDNVTIGDLERKNTLVVGTKHSQLPLERANQIIYGSDGSVRFSFFVTN